MQKLTDNERNIGAHREMEGLELVGGVGLGFCAQSLGLKTQNRGFWLVRSGVKYTGFIARSLGFTVLGQWFSICGAALWA